VRLIRCRVHSAVAASGPANGGAHRGVSQDPRSHLPIEVPVHPVATVNVPLSEAAVLRVVLQLAQARYRVRILCVEDLRRASNEADAVLDGIGLTAAERTGTRIEVSASDGTRRRRGAATATFAELELTRNGWRVNRIARQTNRDTQSCWLVTSMPTDSVLAGAAARVLRRGTNGVGRLP